MQTTFNFYEDPGHGWLRVPLKLLSQLNIADQISHYSYKRGDYAYLEEDCDFTVFHKAMKDIGKEIKWKTFVCRERSSKIRSYDNYR